MLDVRSVESGYGRGPDVLQRASITVEQGEVVSLVGLNGAGKSTLVRTITGLIPLRSGSILFEDDDISHFSPDRRVRKGVVLVPEGRELCTPMTVEENLMLGTVAVPRTARRAQARLSQQRVFDLFPILADRRHQKVGTLSGGQQQMVAIGRALMSSPKLLILDEPSLGLAPILIAEIFEVLRELNRQGLSILLVEQNVAAALAFSSRAYHLELGKVSATEAGREEQSLLRQTIVTRTKDVQEKPALRLPKYSGAFAETGPRRPIADRRKFK